jgi:hypothetical protein
MGYEAVASRFLRYSFNRDMKRTISMSTRTTFPAARHVETRTVTPFDLTAGLLRLAADDYLVVGAVSVILGSNDSVTCNAFGCRFQKF